MWSCIKNINTYFLFETFRCLKTNMMSTIPFLYFLSGTCFFLVKCADPPVVPFPPTIIKQPPHEQLYQVAQTQDEKDNPFMLECEAQGNPEPE